MKYLSATKQHLDILCNKYNSMMPSELDLNGDVYNGERKTEFKRVYRNIDAPDGKTLYWDQPLLDYAISLGGKYKNFADNAISDFLSKSKAENNMLLWGNHYYYSDRKKSIVRFVGEEEPVPCTEEETGYLHELRPILPCFEEFFEIDYGFTEKYTYQLLKMHLVDEQTGEFNRHADNKRGYAFMESGGILAKISCLLYKKNGDGSLIDYAKNVAGFSYSFRNEQTGLIENCPTQDRWDKHNATTETFHWCSNMLDCYEITKDTYFLDIAKSAADAYIKYGIDEEKGKIYGCINVKTGIPLTDSNKETIYMPDAYSNPWQSFFPTHDYIFSMADVVIRLYRLYSSDIYIKTAEIIVKQVIKEYKRNTFAENYGYSISLMVSLYKVTDDRKFKDHAIKIADYSLDKLFTGSFFKGHPLKNSCAAVDGIGYLFKAYKELEGII